MHSDSHDGPPRALLVAAVAVALTAVVVVLAVAVVRQKPTQPQAVPLATVLAPRATSGECATLTAALPDKLGDAARAPLADPAPEGAAAWRADGGAEPIVLRCGVDRPAEFIVGTPLQGVDDVQWFRVGEPGADDLPAQQQRSTWYAVDRGVYVALTLPQGSGPTAIQQLSDVIAKTLPAKPVDPAPVG